MQGLAVFYCFHLLPSLADPLRKAVRGLGRALVGDVIIGDTNTGSREGLAYFLVENLRLF